MPAETDDRLRRWSTYGVVELGKELDHLRRAMPGSPAVPELERYLAERQAEVERTYGGKQADAR